MRISIIITIFAVLLATVAFDTFADDTSSRSLKWGGKGKGEGGKGKGKGKGKKGKGKGKGGKVSPCYM